MWKWLLENELQCENNLISYERASKMPENDMYIIGIGQAVLELSSFKIESGNHQRGITITSKSFGNLQKYEARLAKMMPHMTGHNFEILKIEIFYNPCITYD